jgi:hypothetical protein
MEVRGQKFEVFGTSNPELRTAPHAYLACLAHHAAWDVAAGGLVHDPARVDSRGGIRYRRSPDIGSEVESYLRI